MPSDYSGQSVPVGDRQILLDRSHHYNAPLDVIFSALTDDQQIAWWLRLRPGEVEPIVVEAEPPSRAVWSSLWPVSPGDTIEFDLGVREPRHDYVTMNGSHGWATTVRLRWCSDSPPDTRGIAFTRQRLNEKIGADLRGVVADFYHRG